MKWLALILALLASPASANEIDYFCIYSNAAAAQADSPVGAFWNGSAWDTSTTFPGISVNTPAALINGNFVVAASVTGTNRTSLSFKPQPMAVSGSAYPIPLGK